MSKDSEATSTQEIRLKAKEWCDTATKELALSLGLKEDASFEELQAAVDADVNRKIFEGIMRPKSRKMKIQKKK